MRNTSRTLRPWFGRPTTRISSPAATEPSERIRRYAPGRNASVKRRTKPISSIRTPSRQQGTRGSATSSKVVPTSQRSPTSAPFTSIPSVVRFLAELPDRERSSQLTLPPPDVFDRVCVDSLVGTSVRLPVRLIVALEVHASGGDSTDDR